MRPDLAAQPDGHSSRPDVTIGLKQPTRPACPERSTRAGRSLHNTAGPIWPCSEWGLPSRHVAMPLVRSYRTFSPLPTGPLGCACGEAWRPMMQRGRYLFCGTIREVTLPGRYPAPRPVESGLSSRSPEVNRRPSDRLRLLPTYPTWARFATMILAIIGLIDARYWRVQDPCGRCIVQCARYPREWMRYRSQVLWTKNR